MKVQASQSLVQNEAVRIAERYVGAYNDRDLEAMLELQHEDVVAYPTSLFGHRPHRGHDGVRRWWAAMSASDRRYEVVVNEIRPIGSDRAAALGEIHQDGELLSPWGVLITCRDGLIVESRSYLSDRDLLEELRILGEE
jgi:ketosteroid isomerase-like protein